MPWARAKAQAEGVAVIAELKTKGAASLRALADGLNAVGQFGLSQRAQGQIKVLLVIFDDQYFDNVCCVHRLFFSWRVK